MEKCCTHINDHLKIISVASTLGAKQKVRKVENNFVLARTNPECEENKEFICPDGTKCGEWECPNRENNTYCNLKCDPGYEGMVSFFSADPISGRNVLGKSIITQSLHFDWSKNNNVIFSVWLRNKKMRLFQRNRTN